MKSMRPSSKDANKVQKKNHSGRRKMRSIPIVNRSKAKGRKTNSRLKVARTNKKTKPIIKKKVVSRQSQGVAIRRSSGRREKFSTDRMVQTVSRSGVPFMLARDITKTVTNKIRNTLPSQDQVQLKSRGKNQKKVSKRDKIISAGKVRHLVAEELRDRNRPDIANSYSGNRPENTTTQGYSRIDDKQQGLEKFSVNTQHSRRNEVVHDQSKRGGGIMT
jgi:transcriptional repressor NrdR